MWVTVNWCILLNVNQGHLLQMVNVNVKKCVRTNNISNKLNIFFVANDRKIEIKY